MADQSDSRRSLLNLFAPPDQGRIGVFGLLCGLSAEEQFMDSTLEQFSGLGRNQRKRDGHLSLVLFLDAHNKPICSLPGLYNPWPVREWPKTKLMHAKTALLGFGESAAGEPDYYRLIVSTGNWTKEAVNNSINLVWYCDYDTKSGEDQKQEAKDINEAVTFWETLLGIGNNDKGYYQLTDSIKEKIENFLDTITTNAKPPQRKYKPRFVSNLLDSNLDKVPKDFKPNSMGAQVLKRFNDSKTRHNFIICGSGFFEEPRGNKEEPDVLQKIISYLKDNNILTKDPGKWLVLNPGTSGAVGQWLSVKEWTIDENGNHVDGWSICCPKHPNFPQKPYPFHAKYIFIANYNNVSVTSGILYFGSGNLSKQGFALVPGNEGNIEAGVIIENIKFDSDEDLCQQLGIDYDNDLEKNDIPESPEGEDSEKGEEFQTPPPIANCIWHEESGKLTWAWTDRDWKEITLNGSNILTTETTDLTVSEESPDFSSGVKLSAKDKAGKLYEWIIPVFIENGDLCPSPPQLKSGKELVDALSMFPETSYEDEDGNGDDEPGGNGNGRSPKVKADDFSELRDELTKYPLHLATTLVETIAVQNQRVTAGRMPDWIAHLERTLIREMEPETKDKLKSLNYNFLEPLVSEEGFAPPEASKEYKKMIREIIVKIGV